MFAILDRNNPANAKPGFQRKELAATSAGTPKGSHWWQGGITCCRGYPGRKKLIRQFYRTISTTLHNEICPKICPFLLKA
jgi:hypothetical protein